MIVAEGFPTRILIVDDKEHVRESLRALVSLESPLYRVLTAANGPEALSILDREPVDIVLCDQVLTAEMSGTEVTWAIKDKHPGVRVVIFTGKDVPGDTKVIALEAGALFFLSKPIHEGELLRVISTINTIRRTDSSLLAPPSRHPGGLPLSVFLCHASADKPRVRELSHRLSTRDVDPWLDEEKLLPGQGWEQEIERAVREADAVITCLSKSSVTKEGFVQREISHALDVAEEKPEGVIYLIPLRLEVCDVPERLRRWHWVDLFEEQGFSRLLKALEARARGLGRSLP